MSVALLREAIRLIICERKTDVEHHNVARTVFKQLLAVTKGKNSSELNMQADRSSEYEDVLFLHVPFKRLGVELPQELGDVEFGVMVGTFHENDENGTAGDGVSIEPGRLSFLPNGGIFIGFNDKETDVSAGYSDVAPYDSIGTARAKTRLATRKFSYEQYDNIDVGHILWARQSVFVHEMKHQLDAFYRKDAPSMHAQMSRDLASGKYGETQHEMNAYFTQAFEDFIESFEEKHPQPTQADVRSFTNSSNDAWEKFVPHVHTGLRNQFSIERRGSKKVPRYNDPKQKWMYIPNNVMTPDALRRKFVTRFIDMWQNYVDKLPVK